MKLRADTGARREQIVLIVFSGLPGTGKTTIARELARQLDAVHVRIDSIEQAIRRSTSGGAPVVDAGYVAGYAVAEDNLVVGRIVVADSVNPLPVTRASWRAVAERCGVECLEIEVVCSDQQEHRRRVETRTTDVPGLVLPTWSDVLGRNYQPWDHDRIVIDTAAQTVQQSVAVIRTAIAVFERRS